MTIEQIIERNYKATVNRGLISESTGFKDFINKLKEEVTELEAEMWTENMPYEMADIALVIHAMAEHYDIDLIDFMAKKTAINEKRKD